MKKGIHLFTIIAAIILIWIAFSQDRSVSGLNQSKLHRVVLNGTITDLESGLEMPLGEEAYKQIGAAAHVRVKGHFTEDIEVNEQVFIYLRRIQVTVYQNGRKIYAYGKPQVDFPKSRSAGNVWGNFYVDGIKSTDEMVMEFYNPYPGNSNKIYQRCLEQLYYGDKMQLFKHMLDKKLAGFIAGIIIFLVGIEMFCVTLNLKMMGVKRIGSLLYCGLLFLSASLWLLIDYDYITLVLPYGVALETLDAIVFLSIPTLALRYAREFMQSAVRKAAIILEWVLSGIGFVYLLLLFAGIVDGEIIQETFRSMLPVIIVLILVCLVYEICKNKEWISRMVLGSGIAFVVCGLIGTIQYGISQVNGVSLVGAGLAIFVFVQYWLLLVMMKGNYDKSKKAEKMEQELFESRIAIMLSQIQPHFLYNSISSIQALCLSEPKKAHDALAQFAHFLRGNMDSLSSKKLIPFEQELKHVKNYLALEKIRFEERLNVRYELEKEGFLLPALTIQPIVENAVRYGISKKKEGGTLTISTQETEKEIIITVEDDGAGFDVGILGKQKDNRSHVGMENVQKRLKGRCNGRMEVVSRIGEGTTVQIFLPK